MPDADPVAPLCSYSQFNEGAFADLVSQFSQTAVNDMLIEATRKCEDLCDRRLAPFTGLVETTRAGGIDPDEYAGTTNIPVSIQGTLGMSEASALNMTNLVRHHWLRETPPRYQDLWTYPSVTVTVVRSYGGTQQLSAGQILDGPDDLGHVWFQLGQFIPVGSYIRIQYSGGYTVAIPGSLVRACRYITAGIAVTELDPNSTQHDPDRLFALGERWLAGFEREGSPLALARRVLR